MKAYKMSLFFGFIFFAVGLLGFIPNPAIGYQGYFVTNTAHNLVHILTGGTFLIGAIQFPKYASRIIKSIGISYVGISILGFLMPGDMMLGLIHINQADRWLHIGLAVIILIAGFVSSDSKSRPTALFMQLR